MRASSALALFVALAACTAQPTHPSTPSGQGGTDAAVPPGVPDGGADLAPGAATDLAPECRSPPAADPQAAMRASCAFTAGALPSATLGLSDADRANLPIKHIIVIMKENRSFDQIFGGLGATRPEVEVFPASFSNSDGNGQAVAPFHAATTCIGNDPDHQWKAMHNQINGGKMDGYVSSAAASTGSDGHFALAYFTETDLPFYYFLANTFALADHHFPSVRSGTFPNRDYLLLGTSDTVDATQYQVWPDPALPSIFDRLSAAGVSWGVYADDHPLEETLNNPAKNWETTYPWKPVHALVDDFAADNLPSVVFVDGLENQDDEHPTADLQHGEAWTKRIYDAAVASKAWSSTAMFLTYDEAGGFFDHVPPPNTCVARQQDSKFFELGTRVPLIAISPWARRHYVSKTVHQHTSITRFIEAVFGLGALTARDANSDALLDMFDFACPPAPVPPAPATGSSGCNGPSLTVDETSYTQGTPIHFTFTNGPGNAKDWIAIYVRGQAPAYAKSVAWAYVSAAAASPHTAGAPGVKSGTLTLDANSVDNGHSWPLAKGSYMANFLIDDGYSSIASVELDIK
jgi:phospholipase C